MAMSIARTIQAGSEWNGRSFGRIHRFFTICLLCLSGIGAAPAAEAASGLLDGMTIEASFVDAAGKKQGDDKLVFASGKLDAQALHKAYAFEPAAYTALKEKNGTLSFTATLTSAEHGSLVVEGRLAKRAASGKRTWSKPGKQPIEHAFTGSAK